MQFEIQTLIIVLMGIAFFSSVLVALYWALKTDQFSNLNNTAKSIFNEEEPIGYHTDYFPNSKHKKSFDLMNEK